MDVRIHQHPSVLILWHGVPLGDLTTRVVAYLPPVLSGSASCWSAQHKASKDGVGAAWVACVRVHQQQLHTGVPQALFRGQIKDKQLIENWVGWAFLHMGFLLTHPLLSMVHVHLDVWFCRRTLTRIDEESKVRSKKNPCSTWKRAYYSYVRSIVQSMEQKWWMFERTQGTSCVNTVCVCVCH